MHEHRGQLKERVCERRRQLQEAFALAKLDGSDERRTALEVALRLVDDATQGGWDRVSEVGATELSRWLDETQFLVASRVPAEAALHANEPALQEAPAASEPPIDRVGAVWEEGTTTQSSGPQGDSTRWRAGR